MSNVNSSYRPDSTGWVVRYWWIEEGVGAGPEQTAHFLDSAWHGDPELSRQAAMDYAKWPSVAGRPVLRVEVQRNRG